MVLLLVYVLLVCMSCHLLLLLLRLIRACAATAANATAINATHAATTTTTTDAATITLLLVFNSHGLLVNTAVPMVLNEHTVPSCNYVHVHPYPHEPCACIANTHTQGRTEFLPCTPRPYIYDRGAYANLLIHRL